MGFAESGDGCRSRSSRPTPPASTDSRSCRRCSDCAKTIKDPLADVKSAERWLASLSEQRPARGRSTTCWPSSEARTERSAERTPQRLEAVFYVDAQTASLREHADRAIHRARDAAGRRSRHQLWSSLFDLTQAFPRLLGDSRARCPTTRRATKWQALLPELVARQIMHLGLDAKIRLYPLRAVDPGEVGRAPRALHARVLAPDRAAAATQTPNGEATTIEHEYPGGAAAAAHEFGQHDAAPPRVGGEPAGRMVPAAAPDARAVVGHVVLRRSRQHATGLRRRTPAPLEGRVLFLDTRPLHALLMQNVVVLEQKIKSQPLSDTHTARAASSSSLLTKLASQVDPEFKPFARRGERTAAAGTVDAIVGFAKISGYLREEERAADCRPRARQELRRHDGARGVRTRAQRERPPRRACARRRLAAYAAPGGPWEVKDVSQTGFRLLAPMSVANAVTLGTLTAIRPHGQHAVDARHRAPDAPTHRRSRRDRAAGDRQHARRRRPGRAAQVARRRLFGRRRSDDDQRRASSRGSSCRCASAKAIPPYNR